MGYVLSSCALYSQDLYQLTILALISPLFSPFSLFINYNSEAFADGREHYIVLE